MITVLFDGYGEKEFIKAFSELEDANISDTSTGCEPLPIIDYDQSDTPSSSSNSTDESIQDASQLVEDSVRDYSEDLHIDSHTLEPAVQRTDAYPLEDTSDSGAYDITDEKAGDEQLFEAAVSLSGSATNHYIGSEEFQAADTTEELDVVISEGTCKLHGYTDEDNSEAPIVHAGQKSSAEDAKANLDASTADKPPKEDGPQPLPKRNKTFVSKILELFSKK